MAFVHVRGGVPQPRIAVALRVHENTVRAAVKRYWQHGDAGFDAPTGVHGPGVMEPCRLLRGEGRTRMAFSSSRTFPGQQ